MNPIFLKELKEYSKDKLLSKIDLKESKFENFINLLLKKNIVNIKNNDKFTFAYVGIIEILGKTLIFLPKYISENNNYYKVMKNILNLFKVYSKREDLQEEELETLGNIYNETNLINWISLIDYLINDFISYGLYKSNKSIYNLNGNENIDWNKTINEINPYITKKEILYFDYYTQKNVNDNEDFIRKLHGYVIKECFKYFNKTGLLNIFGYPNIFIESNFNYQGNDDFILKKIRSEMSVQYTDRKLLLLRALHNFFNKDNSVSSNNNINYYGTRYFYYVWEKVCSYILKNMKNKLNKYIKKPKWKELSSKHFKLAGSKLKPDIIVEITYNKRKIFLIGDAKYYNTYFEDGNIKNHPQTTDVSKQYVYNAAFEEYISKNLFDEIYNIFLLPSENNNIKKFGEVSLGFLKKLGLRNIDLVYFPANKIFNLYIKKQTFNKKYISNLLKQIK